MAESRTANDSKTAPIFKVSIETKDISEDGQCLWVCVSGPREILDPKYCARNPPEGLVYSGLSGEERLLVLLTRGEVAYSSTFEEFKSSLTTRLWAISPDFQSEVREAVVAKVRQCLVDPSTGNWTSTNGWFKPVS